MFYFLCDLAIYVGRNNTTSKYVWPFRALYETGILKNNIMISF